MPEIIYLFDTPEIHKNLLPLSYTRPIAAFRIGIMTIREKWMAITDSECRYLPVEYLKEKFSEIIDDYDSGIFIAGNLLPDTKLWETILRLEPGEMLINQNQYLVFKGLYKDFKEGNYKLREIREEVRSIKYVFDIFRENYEEIKRDFHILTNERESIPLPSCTRLIGPEKDESGNPMVFIEEGAEIECVSINVKRGPVYIGKNSVVMEGACLRGPLALCEGVKIKMGAKIYGGTTFGPYCKIGGEIDNSVIFGYTNKAHDGYLGNAVIGEWCNIGAGVNASNLKNDYSKIRIWNYEKETFMKTDLQFCGLIMGDHSKIGVNCMLNTATVIGVGVNIHGSGFPRVFVPSFREGSPTGGFSEVTHKKFMDIAGRVMYRRALTMNEADENLYRHLHNQEWTKG